MMSRRAATGEVVAGRFYDTNNTNDTNDTYDKRANAGFLEKYALIPSAMATAILF